MSRLLSLKLMVVAAVLFSLSGVSTADQPAPRKVNPCDTLTQADEIKEIRISAIPDGDAKAIEEKSNLVAEYLSKKIGKPVKFMPQQNYLACVTGLATKQLELVWFGGVTGVQADQKVEEGTTFVACREADKNYKSYFIAGKDAKLGTIKDLAVLAEMDKATDWTFTFGSKNSTSGHVMPRHFFEDQAGEKPEDVFKTVAYSGSHDKTIRDVAEGTAHIGALNYKNWDNATGDNAKAKEKCEVIYTTPAYVDYVWVARNGIGDDLIKKIKDALLALDASKPDENKILAAWGAKDSKFVACEKKEWEGIRKVLDAGVDVGG